MTTVPYFSLWPLLARTISIAMWSCTQACFCKWCYRKNLNCILYLWDAHLYHSTLCQPIVFVLCRGCRQPLGEGLRRFQAQVNYKVLAFLKTWLWLTMSGSCKRLFLNKNSFLGLRFHGLKWMARYWFVLFVWSLPRKLSACKRRKEDTMATVLMVGSSSPEASIDPS